MQGSGGLTRTGSLGPSAPPAASSVPAPSAGLSRSASLPQHARGSSSSRFSSGESSSQGDLDNASPLAQPPPRGGALYRAAVCGACAPGTEGEGSPRQDGLAAAVASADAGGADSASSSPPAAAAGSGRGEGAFHGSQGTGPPRPTAAKFNLKRSASDFGPAAALTKQQQQAALLAQAQKLGKGDVLRCVSSANISEALLPEAAAYAGCLATVQVILLCLLR